jgi:hypothetical protein
VTSLHTARINADQKKRQFKVLPNNCRWITIHE